MGRMEDYCLRSGEHLLTLGSDWASVYYRASVDLVTVVLSNGNFGSEISYCRTLWECPSRVCELRRNLMFCLWVNSLSK